MKAISASIIVLAGAYVFTTGATIQHSGTQMFVFIAGGALGIIGLWGWLATVFGKVE
jgi:hypothetical protein